MDLLAVLPNISVEAKVLIAFVAFVIGFFVPVSRRFRFRCFAVGIVLASAVTLGLHYGLPSVTASNRVYEHADRNGVLAGVIGFCVGFASRLRCKSGLHRVLKVDPADYDQTDGDTHPSYTSIIGGSIERSGRDRWIDSAIHRLR
jgi:hypothetical protein